MRGLIRHLYKYTFLGHLLISPYKKLYDNYASRILPEKFYIKHTFKNIFGYSLNLDNPKTLSEKVLWLQVNERKPLHTLCSDKYAVREYIKEKIGTQYLIPLVFHTDNYADIIPDNLPDYPFIIKTNHGSGGHVIVKNKSQFEWSRIQKNLKKLLKSNYYYKNREWQYKNIKPCIIVEKLLLDENSNIPYDYKFHCFNGSIAFISVTKNRQVDRKRSVYDKDWNFLDLRMGPENGDEVKRPKKLDKMKTLVKVIAGDFRYVRVDLYTMGGKIYFGELTFSPFAGFFPFSPAKWGRIFGDKLKL